MKMPASSARIPSLVLAVAWASVCLAQDATNRAVSTVGQLPFRATTAFPESTEGLPHPLPQNLRLSGGTTEIVRLIQSGIDESVVLSFIENSGLFNLSVDHIIYLKDLGVSSQIINTMLGHDREAISSRRQSSVAIECLPAVDLPPATDNDIPRQMYTQSLVIPARSVAATITPADSLNKTTMPQLNQPGTQTQVAALPEPGPLKPETVTPAKPNRSLLAAPEKRTLYPVRQPYPVELTAPIVFLDSPSF